MRKNILYLYYLVVSGFIIVALGQNVKNVMRTVESTTPQYVFTHEVEKDSKAKAEEEAEILRKWAEDFDPSKHG